VKYVTDIRSTMSHTIFLTQEIANMQTYKFRISETQKAALAADVKQFNKLADKLGCPRATLTESEATLAKDPHYKADGIKDITWHVPQIKFFDIELTGGFVVAGDYTFVGSIHYSTVDKETTVTMLGSSVPNRYKDSLPTCDHCNTKRKRKITFIMESNVDGSMMQIGSTCLKDFLGYDVSDLIRALKFCTKFSNISGNYPHTQNTRIKKTVIHQYGVHEILMLTNAVIRQFGWHTKQSDTHVSTVDVVSRICGNPEGHEAEFWLKKVNENRDNTTDAHMANAVVKWADESQSNSEYMHTVHSVISGGTVTTRQFGILCSAVNSYKNFVKSKLEAEHKFNNEYVGTVGKRMEIEVKCIDSRNIEGYYGTTTLHKMIDMDNHLYTWFSTSDLEIPDNRFIKVKGTVKKHEIFNHVKQTVLTRVSKVKNNVE